MHPIETLFAALNEVEPYPPGVIALPERLRSTAFFPGGAGLWMDGTSVLPPLPVGGVMVLGHDFHSEAAFERSRRAGGEVVANDESTYRMGATWKNLLPLLGKAGVPPATCFFTNVYMGLRQGSTTVGEFPGASDAGFVQRCRRFLLRQIVLQRPSIVLTLGAWVPSLLAPLSPELAEWAGVRDFQALDQRKPVVHDVTVPEIGHEGMSVVALTHPSFRTLNVGRRRYSTLAGNDAELTMIREALDRTRPQASAPCGPGRT